MYLHQINIKLNAENYKQIHIFLNKLAMVIEALRTRYKSSKIKRSKIHNLTDLQKIFTHIVNYV